MTQYQVAPGKHYCYSGPYCVILDLPVDKYLGLSVEQTRVFRELASGTPPEALSERKIADELIAAGLFCTGSPRAAAGFGVASISRASSAAFSSPHVPFSIPSAKHTAAFFSAVSRTRSLRRRASFQALIERVRNRRPQVPDADRAVPDETLIDFANLRTLTYTKRDECFFDSLALIEYLATLRYFPNWVIGVATHPFMAHCWVQNGRRLLNDSVLRTRLYTPILVA